MKSPFVHFTHATRYPCPSPSTITISQPPQAIQPCIRILMSPHSPSFSHLLNGHHHHLHLSNPCICLAGCSSCYQLHVSRHIMGVQLICEATFIQGNFPSSPPVVEWRPSPLTRAGVKSIKEITQWTKTTKSTLRPMMIFTSCLMMINMTKNL